MAVLCSSSTTNKILRCKATPSFRIPPLWMAVSCISTTAWDNSLTHTTLSPPTKQAETLREGIVFYSNILLRQLHKNAPCVKICFVVVEIAIGYLQLSNNTAQVDNATLCCCVGYKCRVINYEITASLIYELSTTLLPSGVADECAINTGYGFGR